MKVFEKEEISKKQGITLIALVVTILILLILASVTINLLFGDNGIIKKANEAKGKTESESLKESQELESSSQAIDSIVNNGKNLKWLINNKMVVSSENYEYYNNQYNGIKIGTSFLTYNLNTKEIYKPRDATISTSQYGLALLSAYKTINDSAYLNKAIEIGNATIDKKVFTQQILHKTGENGTEFKFIAARTSEKSDSSDWTYDSGSYSYSIDSLLMCKFLIELSNATGDDAYANIALNVTDAWILAQDKIGSGALPTYYYYMTEADAGTGYEGMHFLKKEYPLDIAYSVYLGGMAAYNYTENTKYKDFVDKYFNFMNNAFKNNNATFTFTKDSKQYTLPYEYIAKDSNGNYIGMNQKNQDPFDNNISNDITTDQLFYITLGLASYDRNSEYVKSFYNSINALEFENGKFWGEYTKSGNKGIFEETMPEVIDSAFYIRLINMLEDNPSKVENVKNMLNGIKKESSDPNVDGAWTWDINEDGYIIETEAVAVLIQQLYTIGMIE